MRTLLALALAWTPLVATAYYSRVPGTSIYAFDAISLLLIVIAVFRLPWRRLAPFVICAYIIATVSLSGFLSTAVGPTVEDPAQFAASTLRYVQLCLVIGCTVVSANDPRIPAFTWSRGVLLLSLGAPLAYGLLMLRVRPESVLVFDRFASYFTSPNYLGAFITVGVAPAIIVIATYPLAYRIVLSIVAGVLVLPSLALAGSVSGWMLAAVAAIVGFLSVTRLNLRRLAVLAAIVAALTPYLESAFDRLVDSDFRGSQRTVALVETIVSGGQLIELGSGRGRASLAARTLDVVASEPRILLTGVGLGQSPRYVSAPGRNVTAHNAFLVLLVELGVLGLGAFLAVFVYALREVGVTPASCAIAFGYFAAMLGTPHVYMPFLWSATVFGWYSYRSVAYSSIANECYSRTYLRRSHRPVSERRFRLRTPVLCRKDGPA